LSKFVATDHSQTRHLDRWDRAGHRFIFGIAAMANLVVIAEGLSPESYSELERPAPLHDQDGPRQARERHKKQVVRCRQFETLKLLGEEVAEYEYRAVACEKAYQVSALRKKLVVEKGRMGLFEPRSVPLLHHQRPDLACLGDRDPGQR
jgi:hypothetical protein